MNYIIEACGKVGRTTLPGPRTFSIGLFTRVLGRSPERVQLYLAELRGGMKKREAHTMFN